MRANINILESVAIAMSSLRANKLRSFLTLLGIIIGVTTVIAVVTIIQGLNRYVKNQMFAFGSNTFMVQRTAEMHKSLKEIQEMMKRRRISYEDFLYIRDNAKIPELVEAVFGAGGFAKVENTIIKELSIRGETKQNYLTGRSMDIEMGRFLSAFDEENAKLVCVIGNDVHKELFKERNPVGEWIQVNQQKYKVIGAAKSMGKILGFSLDNFIIIPITTFRKYYDIDMRDITINVKTRSIEEVEPAKEEIRTILRSRRNLKYSQADDFAIEDSQTFIDAYNNLTGVLYSAMIIIASISMLVGGIVIMNIMLVSVTERIKEIGLRKAVGARRRDILIQFLIESSCIAAVGGIIGVFFGFLIAKTVSLLTPLPAALEWWSVVLAIVISSSVGLFFGIFPANRAAKLDPVVALRED